MLAFWTMIGTLWIEGERSPWSPDFSAQALPALVVGASRGPIYEGAQLFYATKGCEYCHQIEGYGGQRGLNLFYVRDRLSNEEITIRIVNGGTNMPAFGGILSADDLNKIVAFLDSRGNSLRPRQPREIDRSTDKMIYDPKKD